MALWLLGNGIAHQIGVLIGNARGTLRRPDELGALLAVGAGLLLAGVIATWAIVPLSRGRTSAALASVGVVAIVVVAIATRYGWMFLGGTSVIAIVNAVVLARSRR